MKPITVAGRAKRAAAKMIGMTPPWLTAIGR
jgi:hypothetical protein